MRAALALALAVACAPAGRAVADPARDPGKVHFARGARAFLQHDYETAIIEYQASYDLSGHPLLLYNLGQAYRRSGDPERALRAFERYLAASVDGRYRELAAEQVRAIERELAASVPASEPEPESEPPIAAAAPPPPPRPPRLVLAPVERPRPRIRRAPIAAALSLLAAGVVCIGTGTGLLLHAESLVEARPASLSALAREADDVRRERIAAWTLYAVSGAAIVGAALSASLWWRSRSLALRLQPSAGGVTAALEGVWP